MGERGPPQKPREQHERQGTYRADKHGSGRLPIEIPDMPPDLSPVAQGAWNTISLRLLDAGLVTAIDGAALRLLCESWALYLDCQDDIATRGIVIEMTNKAGYTNRVPNPAVRIRSDAWRQIYSMLRQFGLTPSSRTGLDTATKLDDQTSLEGILGFQVN